MASKAPKDWVAEYVAPESRASAYEKQGQIASLLDSGIVLIGEAHDNEDARAVIANLIASGNIKHLVLEITEYYAAIIPEFKKEIQNGAKQLSLAAKGRENSLTGKASSYAQIARGPMMKGDNIKINFGLLIYRALKYGCEVYAGDSNQRSMTSPKGMNARDAHVSEKIKSLRASGVDTNIAVLFGASHFSQFASKEKTLDAKLRIDTLSGTANHRVFYFA